MANLKEAPVHFVITVPGVDGRLFGVRILSRGDRYGLNDKLVYGEEKPQVEFYDLHSANKKGFGPNGQFVSRYYLSTLLGLDKYGGPPVLDGEGLDLMGYEPVWKIPGKSMDRVRAVLQAESSLFGTPQKHGGKSNPKKNPAPEACVKCEDTEPMDKMLVDVDGYSVWAWVCWNCGHAHTESIEGRCPKCKGYHTGECKWRFEHRKNNPSRSGYVAIPLTDAMRSALQIYVLDPIFTENEDELAEEDIEMFVMSKAISQMVKGSRLVVGMSLGSTLDPNLRLMLQRIINRLGEAANSADDDAERANDPEIARLARGHRTALENLQGKVLNLARG